MRYLNLIIQHIQISLISLAASLILSIFFVYLAEKNKKIKKILLNITTLAYAIPSLAMFALLIKFVGLGKLSVIISLTIYSQYILVRSFITLLDNFDKDLLLASHSMGLREKTILFKIKLPLLKNHIVNSIKISVSTIISIANIGAIVNAGGLGVLIFNGLRISSSKLILLGILLNAIVYLIFEISINIITKILSTLNRKNN